MDKVDMIDFYLNFARPLYAGKDVAHDFRHIERIISRLSELAEGLEPPPCSYKLNFLACFHGLGPKVDNDPELRAKIVVFLRDIGWKQQDIDASLSSLTTHLSDPRTSEELIVHDANYFEVTGAFGIAKAFMVGGARGQSYEQTVAIFDANLRRLTFRTPFGKRCYDSRKAYAEAYLAMLRDDPELPVHSVSLGSIIV
jgi:hypothetical protein